MIKPIWLAHVIPHALKPSMSTGNTISSLPVNSTFKILFPVWADIDRFFTPRNFWTDLYYASHTESSVSWFPIFRSKLWTDLFYASHDDSSHNIIKKLTWVLPIGNINLKLSQKRATVIWPRSFFVLFLRIW